MEATLKVAPNRISCKLALQVAPNSIDCKLGEHRANVIKHFTSAIYECS
jgi:hypothetical protein